MIKRVTHVVASIAEEASGPSYSVPSLCAALNAAGWQVNLRTVGPALSESRNGFHHTRHAPSLSTLPILKQLCTSAGLRRALSEDAKGGAVLHDHGLWLMPNVYPARAAASHRTPFVISPRGMLGEAALSFSKRRKQIMWATLQSRAARQASLFHATSDGEYDDIRRMGLRQPVAVIPNGVGIPELPPRPQAAENGGRTLLYLGRLHPKKGIDKLLLAWSRLHERFPAWSVSIAGPSEGGCREDLEKMQADLDLPRVSFPGPLYADQKWAAYARSDLFVLPTLNENFGMTIAEALSIGVPAVCTKEAPWAGLETHDAGWWVDGHVDHLASALSVAMALPIEELRRMGQNGRAWMIRDFGWPAIGAEMGRVYDWLLGRGDLPVSVRIG